jgi:hypothetical protein
MIALITLISCVYLVKHSSVVERLHELVVSMWALQAAAAAGQLQPVEAGGL